MSYLYQLNVAGTDVDLIGIRHPNYSIYYNRNNDVYQLLKNDHRREVVFVKTNQLCLGGVVKSDRINRSMYEKEYAVAYSSLLPSNFKKGKSTNNGLVKYDT